MASINTRNTAFALVPETTEGTPVEPSAATQYTSVQAAFTMAPQTAVLESPEYRPSIGQAKPILGAEAPAMNFQHVLRHSGTEGTAPDYNDALKAFFGAETVNGTQRTTDSGSTTSVINVGAGTGSDFVRGSAMLIKDPTNGRRIRAVYSRSTDAITLGFQVPTAPASGIGLGKCIYYTPQNSGHQTLTAWQYIGNGGAIKMMAGARFTGLRLAANAGELINLEMTAQGLGFYMNPIVITSSTRYIDFTDDDGTFAAAVEVRAYKDPHELAEALQTAMRAANTGETHTVTYSNSTGKFTFTCTGTALSLLWNSGANTANSIATKVGFTTAADSSGTAASTGYTSANAMTLTSPYTPTLDDAEAIAARNHEVMIGDASDYTCFNADEVVFDAQLTRALNTSICATTGVASSIIVDRKATLTVSALLDQYNAEFFKRYRAGTTTRFQYSFGVKSGNQWVEGKCGYLFLPTLTVTGWDVVEQDGQAKLNLTLTPYVDSSGNGEMYLGFL